MEVKFKTNYVERIIEDKVYESSFELDVEKIVDDFKGHIYNLDILCDIIYDYIEYECDVTTPSYIDIITWEVTIINKKELEKYIKENYFYLITEINKFYICTYSDNYSDEFDIDSFSLFTGKEKKIYSKILKILDFDDEEFYFGTNECICINSEDFKDNLDFKEISESEYNSILKLIGKNHGLITPKDIIERAFENTEESEEISLLELKKLQKELHNVN